MRSPFTLFLLAALVAAAPAQDVYRRAKTLLDSITLTKVQKVRIDALDKTYAPRLQKLSEEAKGGKVIDDARDDLNREYSKAMIAVMTKAQRTTYLEAVYRFVEEFVASHKGVTFDDVFVWGGAYAKKPAAKT